MEARENSRIGAVILAAGTSSRMGEAKQLLRLDKKTLLSHVAARSSRVGEISKSPSTNDFHGLSTKV
jgi:molybdenum cofactor cytidylyltransferase